MKFVVTGAAGFIGYHLCQNLLRLRHEVIAIDSVNDYYSVELKNSRLEQLKRFENFKFHQVNIADKEAVFSIFRLNPDIDFIIHLAAQAGVRYSLENPFAYIESNLTGHTVMLEAARHYSPNLKHMLYASSSSVYGANTKQPYSVDDRTDNPVSLYAATKKSCELLSESYHTLYKLPLTGLRFFTVYGPYGRPDMAYFSFTQNIVAGKPIKIFNNGNMQRDFTYVDDITAGIMGLVDKYSSVEVPLLEHKVYNLGNNQPVYLMDFVSTLEDVIGKKAVVENLPMQKGDVVATYADIDASKRDFGFEPKTDIKTGLAKFYDWYKDYYTN